MKNDLILWILIVLLLLTVMLFFQGLTPWPYGILVIAILIVGRLSSIAGKQSDR